MWRVRQKELELSDRVRGRSRDKNRSSSSLLEICRSPGGNNERDAANTNNANACSSSKRVFGNCYSREDEGLRDEEVEKFLHARVKHGRGAMGSRIDEIGPYLPRPESTENLSTRPDLRDNHVVLGPRKPSLLMTSDESSEELDKDRRKKAKKVQSSSSDMNLENHKRKESSRYKKKKRKDKRSKH